MGIYNSTRRNRMDDGTRRQQSDGAAQPASNTGESGAARDDQREPDLANVLSYLIRSGQVRILTSENGLFGDEEDEDMYDVEISDYAGPVNPPADMNPDTSTMEASEFKQEVLLQSGVCHLEKDCTKNTVTSILKQREMGMGGRQQFSQGMCSLLSRKFLPNHMSVMACYQQKAFCGVYSTSGDIFLSACQDQKLRIYDTTKGNFREFKTIRALDVGWSVLDTAFSPDGNYLIYSSWSSCVHLCNIYGEHETHVALPINPVGDFSFCIFSLTFSMDNQEILGGANDGCIYVYDRERNERTYRIDAHEGDINAVAFADGSSQILFSGGDDGLVKVWDRRMLGEGNATPVGILAGHMDGITFIDSKGDGRYLISNCKDQTIKLWDMRRFSNNEAQAETLREVSKQNWDYRWQQVPKRVASRKKRLPGDSSLMTYRGHSVLHTLVRCRFSPQFTTGQRYIYTGSATGAMIIYDVLTGQTVEQLKGHRACVRDVHWHPYEQKIISTSWDGSLGLWEHTPSCDSDSDMPDSSHSDSDLSDDAQLPRRSRRLRKQSSRSSRTRGRRFMLF